MFWDSWRTAGTVGGQLKLETIRLTKSHSEPVHLGYHFGQIAPDLLSGLKPFESLLLTPDLGEWDATYSHY